MNSNEYYSCQIEYIHDQLVKVELMFNSLLHKEEKGNNHSGTSSENYLLNFDEQIDKIQDSIDKKLQDTLKKGISLPIINMTNKLKLNHFEVDILFICLAFHLDIKHYKFLACVQKNIDHYYPTVGLILLLLAQNLEEKSYLMNFLEEDSPLFYWKILNFSTISANFLYNSIYVDKAIINYIVDDKTLNTKIAKFHP